MDGAAAVSYTHLDVYKRQGLTRSLAMELAPSGIRVNCVAPGVIETDMVRVLGEETIRDLVEQTPLGRLGRPEDIAEAVV